LEQHELGCVDAVFEPQIEIRSPVTGTIKDGKIGFPSIVRSSEASEENVEGPMST